MAKRDIEKPSVDMDNIRSIIRVGKVHAIIPDKDSWKVCKLYIDKKTGEEKWLPQTYHWSLSQAVRRLHQDKIRCSDFQNLEQLAQNIEVVNRQIAKALYPLEFTFTHVADPIHSPTKVAKMRKKGEKFLLDDEREKMLEGEDSKEYED